MKRLLVICHGFPPYYGGAEHVAYYLAREAASNPSCEVKVLTSDIGGRLAAQEEMDGMDIVRVATKKANWERHSVPEMISFLRSAKRQLPRLLASFRPDHVMAHFTYPAGALAREVYKRDAIPYSVVLHGSDVPGYQPGRFGMVYPVYAHFARRVWRDAARVISVSEPLRDLAANTWNGDIRVIDNGVDTRSFTPNDTPRERDTFKIVVTAQLIHRKGIQDLIPAIAQLELALRSRVQLDVYGVGSYQPTLQSLAEQEGLRDQVTFHGLIDHEKMPDVLADADMFALPSLQEGLPLALLEAAASGLPIVATNVGGAGEVFADRESAMLVQAGDGRMMSSAIGDVMQDAVLRQHLSIGAREVAKKHAWDKVWQRYSEMTLELAGV